MLSSLAKLFGYLLNFLYEIFNNYGWALISFSILIKLAMLPLTIKQQRTIKKTSKIQQEIKAIQFKYKNDQQKMNQEMMDVYKRENMNPMSGCFTSIIQIILILSVFYMVRSPLTYMKKIDTEKIEAYKTRYVSTSTNYPEIEIIRNSEDEETNINMNFFGLDLSSIPNINYKDFKVYIIPVLYVLSSIISTKMTMKAQNMMNVNTDEDKDENSNNKNEELESMQSMNKGMSYMMPIMAVSISLVAPLGLGLYWLMNNILMIAERILTDKILSKEEE